jgi:ABC-2 type transport system permease protein
MEFSLLRVKAIIQRHLALQFRDLYRIIDMFYWPFIDLAIWGFTGLSMDNAQTNVLILLSGIFLWTVCYRANLEVSVNILEELWGRNLVNLFTTPCTMFDWIGALLALGAVRTCVTTAVFAFGVWLVYGINLGAVLDDDNIIFLIQPI